MTHLIVGVAIAVISYTMTQTMIFEGWRNVVRSLKSPFLTKLVHCPWCLSHWILLAFYPLIEWPKLLEVNVVGFDHLLNYFAVLGISSVFHLVMFNAYKEPPNNGKLF